MKLQLKRSPALGVPLWHPNFRDTESLPDLKVVRTSFFVNLVFLTAAAAALLHTSYREFAAASIRAEIRASESRMEAVRAQNDRYVAMNQEFAGAARKFAEASKFVETRIRASELISALSRSLPTTMDFTSVIYEGNRLTLRGTVRGSSDSASARLSAYLEVLRDEPMIGSNFPDVSITSMLRDPRSQGLSFEIVLKPQPAKDRNQPPKA